MEQTLHARDETKELNVFQQKLLCEALNPENLNFPDPPRCVFAALRNFPNVSGPNGCFGDASFTMLAYEMLAFSASVSHEDVITRFGRLASKPGALSLSLGLKQEDLQQVCSVTRL